MTPKAAYRRLNKLLWLGRLPDATIVLVENETIPRLHGITLHDAMFAKPVVVLNKRTPWGLTLVHEMLHIAEPELPHGKIFETIVRRYWRIARKNIGAFQKSQSVLAPQEAQRVE
jgi:hypothetical protein